MLFWGLASCRPSVDANISEKHWDRHFSPEDGDAVLLRNVGIYRLVYTVPELITTAQALLPLSKLNLTSVCLIWFWEEYRNFGQKAWSNRWVWRTVWKWDDKFKVDLTETVCESLELRLSGSIYGTMCGFCEHGNEPQVSVESGEVLYQVIDC